MSWDIMGILKNPYNFEAFFKISVARDGDT